MDEALNALNTLFFVNDSQKKKEANKWLEQFQRTTEAWVLADKLLNAADRPEAQMFGAQTIRRKIMADFIQLDPPTQASLRDSILNLLQTRFASGPGNIVTQLCLGLAGLAFQMESWQQPYEDVVQLFSQDARLFPVLLEFLAVLPEEIHYNSRIPTPDSKLKFFHQRSDSLLASKGAETLRLLLGFLQAKPSDSALAEKVLRCVSSWVKSGDISVPIFQASPMMTIVFQALQSDELFDTACDLIVEVIRESSRSADKLLPFVQSISPMLSGLLPLVQQCNQRPDELEDKQRGLTRIFAESGEIFLPLIVQSLDNFRAIMNGIVGCSIFPDLEVVPILFTFWTELTSKLSETSYTQMKPLFFEYYRQLSAGMIKHLRYPDEEMTAKDRDGFREFRHSVGDVLKDCCFILGEQEMLSVPFKMIAEYMSSNAAANPESWRDLEALLFALRAIGSEVAPSENTVLPQILSYITTLKHHPKIRYGVTLVLGRYSEWTKNHPEFIGPHLTYISEGFSEVEIASASAMALKYLCESCGSLMVNYLKDLHSFYFEAMTRLKRPECADLTEAIAYIINAVPHNELLPVLQSFILPMTQRLQQLVSSLNDPNAVNESGDIMGRLSMFFRVIVVNNFSASPAMQQHPCIAILDQILPIIDSVLLNNNTVLLEEAACLLFKTCVISYNQNFAPLIPRLVQLFVRQYSVNHCPGFPWVGSHIIQSYGTPSAGVDPAISEATRYLSECFIRETVSFLKTSEAFDNNFELVEDFFKMVLNMLSSSFGPLIYVNYLTAVVQMAMFGLNSLRPEPLESTLFFIRDLLGRQPNQNAEALKSYRYIVNESCPLLVNSIIGGVVGISAPIPYPASLYQAISSVIFNLGDVNGAESVVGLISQAIFSLHAAHSDRLSMEVASQMVESMKAGFELKRVDKIRFALARLSSAFYNRTAAALRQQRRQSDQEDD